VKGLKKSLQKLGALAMAAAHLAAPIALKLGTVAVGLGTAIIASGCPSPVDAPNTGIENEYDKDGYDKNGYDRDGYNRNGYDKNGYNKEGYDADGYNVKGYDKDGYDRDGYDEDGYDVDGYDRNELDEDGYNREGYNEDGYDRDGYDADGYDVDGWDEDKFGRDGFHRETGLDREGYDREGYHSITGYNRDGWNRAGQHQDGPIIPSYITHSSTTVADINFNDDIYNGTVGVLGLAPYENTSGGNTRQGAVSDKWRDWLCKMQTQNRNLVSGYDAVKAASAYPDPELSKISDIINGENTIHTALNGTKDIATYLNSANNQIDTVLGSVVPAGNATEFNTYLTAYRNGAYYNQKNYDDGNKQTDAKTAYLTALSALRDNYGFSYPPVDPSGNPTAVLGAMEPAMLALLDSIIGVDAANTAHRSTISGLNADLIKQIRDLQEAQATADDLADHLGYQNKLGQNKTFAQWLELVNNPYNTPKTNGPISPDPIALQNSAKATHLAGGFDADLLKLQPYTRDEKTGIEIA
jgi:hypothetical protein